MNLPRRLLALRLPRRFQLTTTPGRIRVLAAGAMLMLVGLITVTGVAAAEADAGLRAVGRDQGLTAIAISDVYLALADMDAEATRVLLAGNEDGRLCGAGPSQTTVGLSKTGSATAERGGARPDGEGCALEPPRVNYEVRREDAQQAMLKAVELTHNDP